MIYVIHYDGEPLVIPKREGYATPRPSKRVYHSPSAAKRGLHDAYVEDRKKLEIVQYVPITDLIAMAEIAKGVFLGSVEPFEISVLLQRYGLAFDDDGDIIKQKEVSA